VGAGEAAAGAEAAGAGDPAAGAVLLACAQAASDNATANVATWRPAFNEPINALHPSLTHFAA
jgi:hypothetical protein